MLRCRALRITLNTPIAGTFSMPTSREFWDRAAEKYDRRTKKGPNYAARLDRAAAWVGPDARVLDVGCAGGHIALDLAPRVGHVHGIDISPKLIGIARRRADELGVDRVTFDAMTVEDPALEAGAYDAITAYSVLHLLNDVPATLRRFHVLLRPGGRLIVEAPCREELRLPLRVLIGAMRLIGRAPAVHVYGQAEYESMFREAGFTIDEVKVYNPRSLSRSFLATRMP